MAYEPLNPGDKLSPRYVYEELRRIAAELRDLAAEDTTTTIDTTTSTEGPTPRGVIFKGVQASIVVTPTEEIWLPASKFTSSAGTPALSTVGGTRHSAWLLDSATLEAVQTSVAIPVGWTTFSTQFYYVNAGAGAGNVVVGVQGKSVPAGSTTNVADDFMTRTTSAAGTQDVVVVANGPNHTSLTATTYHSLRAVRDGTDIADTLGNDIGFLGVKLRKV